MREGRSAAARGEIGCGADCGIGVEDVGHCALSRGLPGCDIQEMAVGFG